MLFLNTTRTIGIGATNDQDFIPLVQFPIFILVGVTAVGKTTMKKQLSEDYNFHTLPDRRILTDRIIIPQMQNLTSNLESTSDRALRFTLSEAYKKKHPGGMAQILSLIKIKNRNKSKLPVLFDGLRGLNEVRFAATRLPKARFIVLTTPDPIRIMRLLQRHDSFDQAKIPERENPLNLLAGLGSPEQLKLLLDYAKENSIDDRTLQEKAQIVIDEKKYYDQNETCRFLTQTFPEKTIAIDSAKTSCADINQKIERLLSTKFSTFLR